MIGADKKLSSYFIVPKPTKEEWESQGSYESFHWHGGIPSTREDIRHLKCKRFSIILHRNDGN